MTIHPTSRRTLLKTAAAGAAGLSLASAPSLIVRDVAAQDATKIGGRYFAQTGHNLREPFLGKWKQYGDVKTFGMPISEERFVEGVGIAQTFEKLTLVYDPGVAAPFDFQSQHLPKDVVRANAPASAREKIFGVTGENVEFFPQTGHSISGAFLSFWRANGDLSILGLPLSEAYEDRGTGLKVQVFERAVVEGKGTETMTTRPIASQLAAAAGLFSDPAFLPAPPSGGTTKLVKSPDGLRLRSGPSMESEMIALLPDNAEFIVAPDAKGEWLEGYADGFAGWVFGDYTANPPALAKRSLEDWKLDVWQGAALGETNVRKQPTTDSDIVEVLLFGDEVTATAWVKGEEVFKGANLWAQIGEDKFVYARNIGRNAPVAATPIPADAPTFGRWIDVNLTQQLMHAYDGRDLKRTMVTTTGMAGWETPPGYYAINHRVPNETMTSGAIGAEHFYKLEDVLFTQYFSSRGHAIHYAWWRTPETIGRPGSHGCLNTLLDDARFLWDWADIGTPVLVHY